MDGYVLQARRRVPEKSSARFYAMVCSVGSSLGNKFFRPASFLLPLTGCFPPPRPGCAFCCCWMNEQCEFPNQNRRIKGTGLEKVNEWIYQTSFILRKTLLFSQLNLKESSSFMCSILSILFMVIPSSTTSSGYNRSIQGIFFLPQPIHFLMEFRLERFVTVCLYQGTLCPPHSGPAAGPSHVHKRDHHCTHEHTGMDCHEGTMNEGIYGISLPHTCTKGGYPPYQKGNLS